MLCIAKSSRQGTEKPHSSCKLAANVVSIFIASFVSKIDLRFWPTCQYFMR